MNTTESRQGHFPGPWLADGASIHRKVEKTYPGHSGLKLIAQVAAYADSKMNHPETIARREATARLIAAAPALLEIVQLISECEDYSELHMDEIGAAARAAIALALGKEQP